MSRYFGSIETQTGVAFSQSGLNPATYQATSLYDGIGWRAGVFAEPTEGLRLAAVFETGAELEIMQQFTKTYVDLGQTVADTTSTLNTNTLKLPPRFTFGASYRTGRFNLLGEFSLQSWNADQFKTARNSNRVAIGVDRLASESVNATGFERWDFRFGAFYDQTSYSLPEGDVNQMGLTLGAGIPLTTFSSLNANTTINVGTEFGVRGTTNNGLTQEVFGKLFLQVSISELWFVRSRK
jgi:hypothetical protein